MLVVIPISKADAHLAVAQSKLIAALGHVHHTDALVVRADELDPSDAAEVELNLKKAFRRVHSARQAFPGNGWPAGPNAMFKTAASLVKGGNYDGWYFMEPDVTPICEEWLLRLEAEYFRLKRPLMGVRETTRVNNPQGVTVNDPHDHMVGTGVYPVNLSRYSSLWELCPTYVPWDVFCRLDFLRDGMFARTDLIAHNWQSVNYRRENGILVCDKNKPEGIDRPISNPAAVLVHGCKDLSLANLIFSERAPKPVKANANKRN